MKEIKQKLKFSDYVFEIDGKDMYNGEVTYSFGTLESVSYIDGKRNDTNYEPFIYLCISGTDNMDKEVWFSFMLKMDLDMLNKFPKEPTNIINYVSNEEAFIKKADDDESTFLIFEFPREDFNDIYRNLSSVWISKLDENKFIFKVCIPSEKVFTYFEVDLIEK